MKKLVSTVSHLGVIALALSALLIGTLVWCFERLSGDVVAFSDAPPDGVDLILPAVEPTADANALGGRPAIGGVTPAIEE